jgi:diketogulonate reductase-like aldo/keto reductase
MAIPKTKKVKGFEIPTLGLGTWGFGGFRETDASKDTESIKAIESALEMGYRHIDTAEIYGAGHTEELIAKAIKGFAREKLLITSKVQNMHLKYDDVLTAAKGTLKRLDTDYVDLYLVHAPNEAVPIKETIKAMNFLVSEGMAKHIGVSNFSLKQFKEAQAVSENKIVAHTVEYNLMIRNEGKLSKNMESEVLPYCQQNEVIFMAWRPLGKGELMKPGFPLLDEMAAKYGKTHAQIALNWLVSKKNVVTMPKAASVTHLKENFGALEFSLSAADEKRLDAEFKPQDVFYEGKPVSKAL